MHLDLVSFPRPVCIQEVRVIPAGHRVHAAVSERDKMGYVKSCNLKVRTTYMYWRSSTIWKNCWEGFIWIVTRWDIIFQSQTQKLEPPHKSPSFQSVVPYRFLYLFYMSMVSNIILWYSHVLFKHILALPIVHAVMICPITHEFLIPEVHLLPVFYMYSIKTVGEWTIINLKNFRFLPTQYNAVLMAIYWFKCHGKLFLAICTEVLFDQYAVFLFSFCYFV